VKQVIHVRRPDNRHFVGFGVPDHELVSYRSQRERFLFDQLPETGFLCGFVEQCGS
jgi:hypothetical protein